MSAAIEREINYRKETSPSKYHAGNSRLTLTLRKNSIILKLQFETQAGASESILTPQLDI